MEQGDGLGLAQQLMSAMTQLLDHSRTQQTELRELREEMKSMKGEISSMKDELKQMNEKMATREGMNDVNRKQKYHEILLKNQKWEYPLDIPTDVDFETKYFLSGLKRMTCDMRYGRCSGDIFLSAPNTEDIFSYPKHWAEFINALREYQNALQSFPKEETPYLSISGEFQFERSYITKLSSALKSTHFKHFSMEGNPFGRQLSLQFALDYMEKNHILEDLALENITFESDDDIDRICRIIKIHPAIQSITLDDCSGELNSQEILCSIITAGKDKLRSIVFSNGVFTGGSTFIADFLRQNPILKELHLYDNNFTDDDATSIAMALENNTNLKIIDLQRNNLTDVGWDRLLKAEFDSTSLNTAANSNHTCYVDGKGIFNDTFDTNPTDTYTKAVRQKKIYRVLSVRNKNCSNVQHFDDIPFELIPDMLKSIQQYSEYHKKVEPDYGRMPRQNIYNECPLSIVYEVIRGWDKASSLYESLSNR